MRLPLIRLLVLLSLTLGTIYLTWRWGWSLNWTYWWIAIPLVIAETYSLIDSALFGMAMWHAKERPAPPPPAPDWSVDVFITTYNESPALVERTTVAALAIAYPHRTYILDDGNRLQIRQLADRLGVDYLTRGEDWDNRPRHAKAGNLNNALFQTSGEFLLILDADQVPHPTILDHVLGYFHDDKMALVQTPQWFRNVPAGDPLGSQAPLFFGPIQQGKDGWNAAFFCGTNAIVRREALMQLGLREYVRVQSSAVRQALDTARSVLRSAMKDERRNRGELLPALKELDAAALEAKTRLTAGEPLAEVTGAFQRAAAQVRRAVADQDLASIQADLASVAVHIDLDEVALSALSEREWSPLAALQTVSALVDAINAERLHEALPIMPVATLSVTEDMATCMNLHASGWHTAYHDEILAEGLAPEDLGTATNQRLRWCQGTMQVFFRQNPLLLKGLSVPQRLMYFNTMWSYLGGFAAVIYLLAPFLYLVFGILPVKAWGLTFVQFFLPYFLANQLLFVVVGWGRPTWRAQQYSLAMFPVWIRGCWSAFRNVYFGKKLDFIVTPKDRPHTRQPYPWRLVTWQAAAVAALLVGSVIGAARLVTETGGTLFGSIVNWVWVTYDVIVIGVIFTAARYRPAEEDN